MTGPSDVEMPHRQLRLARRPKGAVTSEDFEVVEGTPPTPGDGEFRVRISHISLDPAMRGWMNEGRSYVPPVGLGEVMRAFSAGVVEASQNPAFPVGATVTGLFGVQSHAISDGNLTRRVNTDRYPFAQVPLARWLGGLGMPGQTAYLGLHEIGQPKPGETVVVSAASGAVGSLVGQLAKAAGCRAVGIAGGPDKCRYLTEELGFDAAVDYKAGPFADALGAATPDGIDVYFENVGGAILDAVLMRMNPFGRIPVCGLISAYNATAVQEGPKNLRMVLVHRLRMQGFIVFDFADQLAAATSRLAELHVGGQLKMREDVREAALADYSDVLNELFTGGNFGKLVMRLTD